MDFQSVESHHVRAPAPICEAMKCSVMSRVGCQASGEHWRARFWAVSKALCSSLEGAWTSISTVPQVSFMVECASSIEAIARRRPMSGAAELLASSGGLDLSGFKSALQHSRRRLDQHLNSASSLLHGRVCILDQSHRKRRRHDAELKSCRSLWLWRFERFQKRCCAWTR